METMTVPNSQPPATPEEIWAILRETQRENQREREEARKEEAQQRKEEAQRRKKANREMKELRESIKELRESQKETDRLMQKTEIEIDKMSKNIGGLGNSVGGLIETLIAAHLWEKFPEYNMQRAYRRIPIYDENNKVKTDIDILLVNSEWAMAVEVKREVDKDDVDDHIVRMGRILQYPPALLPPQLKVLGAMAGGVVAPDAAAYAHQCGFFVLELAGESVVRLPDPPDFKPKEWQHGSAD